jgi:hypothetical protein
VLISLTHKFIFVANVKTASTSIEKALRDYAEINLHRSEWGKHLSLGDIELRFARIFELVPRYEFRVVSVIREPLDWLGSLYRSHKSVRFENTPLDTSQMSFYDFIQVWRAGNWDQCRPQATGFRNFKGNFDVDFLIRYDHLNEDFISACDFLGFSADPLSIENASIDLGPLGDLPEPVLDDLRSCYNVDFDILARLSGRPLCKEDKLSALDLGETPTVSPAPAEQPDGSERELRKPPRPITPDDVFWAFRMLLGRDPESETVVEEHLELGTREALRRRVMESDEFVNSLQSFER